VEERLEIITHLVLSRPRLQALIDRFGLYEDMKGRYPIEEIIEKMREDIHMEPVHADVINPQSGMPGSATVAFKLVYEGKDPRKLAEVANVLASAYLEENLKQRGDKARTTFEFLEQQQAALRSEILHFEAQIADFKDQHMGELPELMQINLQTMERLQREIDAKEEQVKTLANRKIYLEGQLATIAPAFHTVSVEGTRVMTPEGELEALRSQYLSLSATLSEEHPDVIALKKRLDVMETEVAARKGLRDSHRDLKDKETELALLSKKFSSQHPDVIRLKKEVARLKEEDKALSDKQTSLKMDDQTSEHPNPSYVNLQTQIASTQMEMDNTIKELNPLRQKHEDYQRRVEHTPQVEQQYRILQRDHANAQAKYQETMSRLMAAREAKGLEESGMAEKFTLLEPPVTPEKPEKPNRLAIILVGLVLAVGAGVGFGSVSEYMDQSVRRADELAEVAGYPVLAVIPYWETAQDRLRRRLKRWALAGGVLGIIVAGLAALHHWHKPLDILWFEILRGLNLGY
jgi:succinoglycan biosynthesis transport protein ExoP